MVLSEESGLESVRLGRTLFVRKVSIQTKTDTTGLPPPPPPPNLQLVFLHGTCATEQQYQLLLKAIDTRMNADEGPHTTTPPPPPLYLRCILYDAMGCGQSPILRNWDAYENQQAVEDLKSILDQHLIKSVPTVIIGHSYAPNIFLAFLQAYPLPNLVGTVFLSTAVRSPHFSLPDGGHPIMRLPVFVLRCIQKFLTEGFIEMAVDPSHEWLRDAIRLDSNRNDMAMAKAYHRHQVWARETDLDVVRDKPALIVHGVNDGVIPVACGQHLANQLPLSKLVIIERASHMVMLEQPEQVADAIVTFLLSIVNHQK